ncbi:MAG TPA: hypothetical protein VJV79_02940 [Polyangiaceae bacterium]|nr:hypothetical protein [Polyangiaceae bacterium]
MGSQVAGFDPISGNARPRGLRTEELQHKEMTVIVSNQGPDLGSVGQLDGL